MRILVVEDDEELREVVCDLLLAAGLSAAAAADYQEACELLVNSDWDVLLADLYLPSCRTGLELAEEAIELGIRPVIMSGTLDKRQEVEACGLQFLAKPFGRVDLLAALRA